MNNWPKWLPYPISWIRALGLTYALTVLVKSEFPLQHSDSIFVVLIGAWTTVPFLFVFSHWAIASVAKFSLARLPAHPKLAPVRQYLTARWSGSERSHWREGINAFIISFVAFVISFLVVSFLTPVPSRADADYSQGFYLLRRSVLQLRLGIIPIGMFFVSAYLYQYDLWARHRRAAKLAAKAKASEPTKRRSPKNLPAPDPVEHELNQLRAEGGMSRMKVSGPASTPETAEWYVFRGGNAEGPYTKMQLLEIQQISDRTKVRRGETEWQRAGEFPGLAAYLTEK